LGEKQRWLGEAAKTQENFNFKNTVGSLKRLVGRPFEDEEILKVEKRFINASLTQGEEGEVAAMVNYAGEEKIFTFTQLAGMFFGKVKEFTEAEVKVPVTDAVISCPGWFTDRQRRALKNAAEIAGIKVLRLINDSTAAALGYGITKTDLPETVEQAKNVVFVDLGHSSYQVAVASFIKGKVFIKGSAQDRNLGGRDFDQVLVEHFIKEFDKKYKLDIKSSSKAVFRLRTQIEKVKKVLSANQKTMLNVECLQDEKDVSAEVDRADFEAWISPICDRLIAPLQAALDAAGLKIEEIDSVELVGGSTRVPLVKEKIAKFFGGSLDGENKLSYTLNQDEAVARGAALQCAIISPVFKVRDFAVQDWNAYPIELAWDSTQTFNKEMQDETVMDAFPVGNAIPSTKILTFNRIVKNKELEESGNQVSFTFRARYHPSASSRGLAEGCGYEIGTWTINGIQKLSSMELEDENKATIKIKTKLDGDGILSIEAASQLEELTVPVEEVKKEESISDSGHATPMEMDEKSPDEEHTESPEPEASIKTKKVIKKHDLSIVTSVLGAPADVVSSWLAAEGEMQATDRLVIDTADRRNALEEYVYDTRSKLDMAWSEFMPDAARAEFLQALNAMEEWLYGEGEDATKSLYVEKLADLKKVGDPVAYRYLEREERPLAEKKFKEYVNSVVLKCDSGVRFFSFTIRMKSIHIFLLKTWKTSRKSARRKCHG
jgi:heat shock protein 4